MSADNGAHATLRNCTPTYVRSYRESPRQGVGCRVGSAMIGTGSDDARVYGLARDRKIGVRHRLDHQSPALETRCSSELRKRDINSTAAKPRLFGPVRENMPGTPYIVRDRIFTK